MILVLHGAKKNVGDFLIRERGLALLRHLRPNQQLVPLPRWEPVDAEQVEQADAVVLCGGPGLNEHFYPKIFPLTDDIENTTTPILPVDLGWHGLPADHPEQFRFDEPSRRVLKSIHGRIGWSGVRDDISRDIVENADVGEVRRTGCTVWYHLPSLGKPVVPVREIRRVVVTPPQDSSTNRAEAIRLLRDVRKRYPRAKRYCVFHRDLRADELTTRPKARVTKALAAVAIALGYKIVDASYRPDKVDFYGECDLHVGYRVHAHLAFVSQHRPSLLICEDGRGVGQLVTFPGQHVLRAGDPDLIAKLNEALDAEEAAGHPALEQAVEEIEKTWPVMRETIEQLPA